MLRMDSTLLFNVFIFLSAACVTVPLIGRFKLGSVLGYLIAGIVIGPFGLRLIGNPEQVLHFAEFGVVMMLFLIGMELEPETFRRMRRLIFGLGSLQVVLTSLTFTALGLALGFEWRSSLAAGMALSLSSTAIVLQMLEEKNLLHTSAGEASFAVLLFQDIAVIPMLIIMPLLAVEDVGIAGQENLLSGFPGWQRTLISAATIASIVVIGKYISRPLFDFVARTNLRELFTATSLALVVGVTLLMQAIGISPALGAFLAGLVLANSPYRHTLEADIQPFKGLLLGLFFISVGMGIDFALLSARPAQVAFAVLVLVTLKAVLLWLLGKFGKLGSGQGALFALSLAQGGEFAFVMFQYASGLQILSARHSAFLTLAVVSSMALTPFLMLFGERVLLPRFMSRLPAPRYDTIQEQNKVIIAGYGRFGQIIGRFLQAQGVAVTVLEKDSEQVALLRKFGAVGYYGDASRLDLLENAGAAKAKLLVVAVDDADKCLEIVRMAKRHFPNLTVFARARNRRHAYELHKAGVDYFRRELFDSSLAMAERAMLLLGGAPDKVQHKAIQFLAHDEKTLRESFAFYERERELIDFSRRATSELERILQDDLQPKKTS